MRAAETDSAVDARPLSSAAALCRNRRESSAILVFRASPRSDCTEMIDTGFVDAIAQRMRAEHTALAARWFERLLAMLPVDARSIFPTDSLLDHVPYLIVEISDYLRHPCADAIAAHTAILEKARQLAALRYRQHASLHQILREYQILGGVLVTFVREEIEQMHITPSASDSVMLVSRLHQAVNVLTQSTL